MTTSASELEMGGTSIVRLGDLLLASVPSELDDKAVVDFSEALTTRIVERQTRGVMLDVTRLQYVDSFIARVLIEITAMARLLGARMIVAGMRPAVAITLVGLGLPLPGVETALTIEHAIERLSAPPVVGPRP